MNRRGFLGGLLAGLVATWGAVAGRARSGATTVRHEGNRGDSRLRPPSVKARSVASLLPDGRTAIHHEGLMRLHGEGDLRLGVEDWRRHVPELRDGFRRAETTVLALFDGRALAWSVTDKEWPPSPPHGLIG